MNTPSDGNDSTTTPKNQTPVSKLAGVTTPEAPAKSLAGALNHSITDPISYDTVALSDFLDMVFHAGVDEDENILTWVVRPSRPPMSPMSEDDLTMVLSNTNATKACYFATSTAALNKSGQLSHSSVNFKSMRVLVLDDIGTKVDVGKIPIAFTPTYIIESSAGNYQYGYVLQEPITDINQAKALIQLAYESGMTDTGGKVAIKAVRLPAGVNGKTGPKAGFRVNLKSTDGPLWTPEGIIEQLGAKVEWADIVKDSTAVARSRSQFAAGASVWSGAKNPTLDGIVDPVLEWLEDEGQIEGDTGSWVAIRCPTGDQHTSGDGLAGYMPLGRGEDPTQRGFNCFHEHCNGTKIGDFLAYVSANNGPTVGATDSASGLTSTWVYDAAEDGVWKVKNCNRPMPLTMSSFRNLHPSRVFVSKADGTTTPVAEHKVWHGCPSRVNVYGRVFAPNDPARIVTMDGHKYINTYAPPTWKRGDLESDDIKKFTEFMQYLIPNTKERNYFLDWLSAKAKNMGFRGPAIVMIAESQGVGRSTLADMMKTLFGQHNMVNVPFDTIVGENQYNDWMESPLVVTDETLNTGTTSYYRTYEKLKELIDPRPKEVTINPKYGKKRIATVHSSFLFLSNHADALSLSSADRRFYVLSNATMPAEPKFFVDLNEWLQTKGSDDLPRWAANVWSWLVARDVDIGMLLAPPESTASKEGMMDASKSPLEVAVEAALFNWSSPHMSIKQLTSIVARFDSRLKLADMVNWEKVVKKLARPLTLTYANTFSVRLGASVIRPKLIFSKKNESSAHAPDVETKLTGKIGKSAIGVNLLKFNAENIEKICESVSEALDLADL